MTEAERQNSASVLHILDILRKKRNGTHLRNADEQFHSYAAASARSRRHRAAGDTGQLNSQGNP